MDTAARIATSISTLTLAYLGAGAWALAAQWLLLEFYMFLEYAAISRIVPKIRIDFDDIHDIFRFGVGVMLRNIAFKLYSLVDVTILGKLVSKTFLGGYTFSKQLTNMPFEKILTLVNRVLFPYFSRARKDLSVMRDWTVRVAELEALFLIPFFIMLFACAEQVILLMLGDNWGMAIFPMRIFCVACVFKLIENYNTMVLTALGYVKVQVLYTLAQLVFIAGGMCLFSLVMTPEKSIYVWIIFYPVIALVLNNFLVRKIKLSYRHVFKRLYKLIVAHGILVGTLFAIDRLFQGAVWSELAMKVLLGGAVYLFSIYLIDRSILHNVYRMVVSKKMDAEA
jgi:O-antigen/teichoic acid export membrane protein